MNSKNINTQTVYIVYSNYFDADGINVTVGGIQTYITNLANLLIKNKYRVIVYQIAKKPFSKEHNGFLVRGVVCNSLRGNIRGRRIIDNISAEINPNSDIVIFGSDIFNVKTPYKSISIQHGISWDIPHQYLTSLQYTVTLLKKFIKAWILSRSLSCVETVVCVDNNFINWYKAVFPYPKVKLLPILNFTEIPAEDTIKKGDDIVKIIFARRFFSYRGTIIFAKAIRRILDRYMNVAVTIAGDGPDKDRMQSIIGKDNRVDFIKFTSSDSLNIHSDKDIAVVPTIGSEGTSLSLLEAMASKCAVICTNVGGMSNIVIDSYNGIMINPDEDELFKAIEKLIVDKELRKKLSEKAYETVSNSFSLEVWEAKWMNVINGLFE